MKAQERQREIIDILVEYGHVKIDFLAEQLSVSKRTILRDVSELSFSYPIYTISGRLNPGIYISSDYKSGKKYINDDEVKVLQELMVKATKEQQVVLEALIKKFSVKRRSI